jgi:membrane peptidoglycan carboxypeptidase
VAFTAARQRNCAGILLGHVDCDAAPLSSIGPVRPATADELGTRPGRCNGVAIVRASARLVILGTVAAVVLAVMAFPVVGGAGLLAAQIDTSGNPLPADMSAGVVGGATTITDSSGAPIAYLYRQFRIPEPSDRIAPAVKAAVVAIEDRRFFQHGGVDPVGTLRALVVDVAGGNTQGGSTLTQQYVKNYELYTATDDVERQTAVAPNLARKLREATLAVQLDHEMSKDQILTGYLNLVYFGHGAYGVGAAAQAYFGTTAGALTVPQAALLAGMVQSPSDDDPITHPDAAKARRDLVIEQMRQQGSISDAEAAAATAAPLGVVADPAVPAEGCTGAGDAGYFCAYVMQYLAEAGLSEQQLANGGYTVRTTLDRPALKVAKAAVDAEVPPTTPHVADVLALIVPGQDAHRVTALVANRTYGNGSGQSSYGLPYVPENLGAGSVYKIFTAATALEQGVVGIDSVIDVPPSGYTTPFYHDGSGRPIPVRNAGDYAPQLSLTDALAQSPNTAFVELESRTGIAPVVDMAVRLGMTSLDDPVSDARGAPSFADQVKAQHQASFTLGVSPTSPLELANVGATLASHGTWCPPTPLASVTGPDGKPVPIYQPACRRAVDSGLADTLMTGLSRDDAPGGTSAVAAAAAGWHRPIAAKTGTTQTSESAAFLGVTPELAGSSIVFDDSASPRPICDGSPPRSCSTGTLFGGTVPARTFYRTATQLLGADPPARLPPVDPRFLGLRRPS